MLGIWVSVQRAQCPSQVEQQGRWHLTALLLCKRPKGFKKSLNLWTGSWQYLVNIIQIGMMVLKNPNNLCRVNEVHKVKNDLFLLLNGFGSVSVCTQYCSAACHYSILQHKCCHFLLYVIWQLKVLVMKMKNTHCSIIIKNNSSWAPVFI